ncbi:MAG: hypothetical protein NXH90_15930, partial [Flavobacteriaceae bacterium]|nr:hypothetical protein [Flavobacteriaceae bacterium]
DENELLTGSGIAGGTLTMTDAGGDQDVDLISSDTGNDIGFGADGALFVELTASGTDFDDTASTLGETTVQGAIDALAANRVSSDPGNVISSGADGGAFLNTTVKPITSVTTNTTPDNTNYTIILNPGPYTATGITLLTDTTFPIGKILILKNNSGGDVNVSGATTGFVADNQALWVQFDGNIWHQIN